MENLTDKLKKYKKLIILGTATAAIFSWLAIGHFTKKYGSGCEIYQGYHRLSDDGRNQYVFDHETKTERGSRPPKHRICGKSSFEDSLTIGNLYRFTTEQRSLPWSKEYIESILPHNLEDSKNK